MTRSVIITCALTGSGPTASKNPHVPVTPTQIAASAIEAAQEGAAIVHVHVRDAETGLEAWRPELFREVVERIRERNTELILNLTTGFGSAIFPADGKGAPDVSGFLTDQMERFAHVQELLPEICSLDCGTMNFGARELFINTPEWLTRGAQLLQQIKVKPEMEVFELGHVRFANALVEKGYISDPPLFQLCVSASPGGRPRRPRRCSPCARRCRRAPCGPRSGSARPSCPWPCRQQSSEATRVLASKTIFI